MLLLASSRAQSTVASWLLTLIALLSFRTISLPMCAGASASDVVQDPTQEGNLEDILRHDTYRHKPEHGLIDDKTIRLPRYPIPHPAPPPVRPPGPPDVEPFTPEGNESNGTSPENQMVCRPFGLCEPCPSEFLNEPYCQPFGNRRLMHCFNETTTSPPPPPPGSNQRNPSPPPAQAANDLPQSNQKGETLAWESCGRIPAQERADFFEFVACNVAFVIIALAIVLWRSRVVQSRQARVLAARIGVGGRGRRA